MEEIYNDLLLDYRDSMEELLDLAKAFENDEQVQQRLSILAAVVSNGLTRAEVESIEAAGFKLTNHLVSIDDFYENRNGFNMVLAGEGLVDIGKAALKSPFVIIGGLIAAIAALIYKFASWLFNNDKSSAVMPVAAVAKLEKVVPTTKSSGGEAPSFFATIKPVNQEAAFKKWVELATDYAEFRSYVIPGEIKDFTDFKRPVTPHRVVDIGAAATLAVEQIALLSDALSKASPEQLLTGGGKNALSLFKDTISNCDEVIKQAAGPMNFDSAASNEEIRKRLQENLQSVSEAHKELSTDLSWLYSKKFVSNEVAAISRDYDSFKLGGYQKLLNILKPFKSDKAVKQATERKTAITKAFDSLQKVQGLDADTAKELKETINDIIKRINTMQAIINTTVSLVGKVNITFNPKKAFKGTSTLSNYVDETINERGEMIGWKEYPIVINERGEVHAAKLNEHRDSKGKEVKA